MNYHSILDDIDAFLTKDLNHDYFSLSLSHHPDKDIRVLTIRYKPDRRILIPITYEQLDNYTWKNQIKEYINIDEAGIQFNKDLKELLK